MDFLVIIHIIIALILILLVLVQDSKGAMGSTFGGGGGANSLFGATGAENILTKSTKVIVIFFAITCILLTRLSSQNRGSVLDTEGYTPTEVVPTEPLPEGTEQVEGQGPPKSNNTDNIKSDSKKADDAPSSTEETK